VQNTLVDNITCWGFGCWSRIPPNYQELQSKDVPKAEKDGVQVAVIAVFQTLQMCGWIIHGTSI
jgi:hypothetical protein